MKNKTPFTDKEYKQFMGLIGLSVPIGFALLGYGDIAGQDAIKIGGILLMCSMLIPLQLYYPRWHGHDIEIKKQKLDKETAFKPFPIRLNFSHIRERLLAQSYFPVEELSFPCCVAYTKKNTVVVLDESDDFARNVEAANRFLVSNRSEARGWALYYVCRYHNREEGLSGLATFYKEALVQNDAQIQFKHFGEDAVMPEPSFFFPLVLQAMATLSVSRRIVVGFQKRILNDRAGKS